MKYSYNYEPSCVDSCFHEGHSIFYQFLRQYCLTKGHHVILAGSAALDVLTRFHHKMSIAPNDVDFFSSVVLDEETGMKDLVGHFECSQSIYRIDFRKIPYEETCYPELDVREVWNLRLTEKRGNDYIPISPGAQLICLDFIPESINQREFAINVLNRFDLNICKCAIENPCFMNDSFTLADVDIMNYTMQYDLTKFRGTQTMVKRISKYQDRGFKLKRIGLDHRNMVMFASGNIMLIGEMLAVNYAHQDHHGKQKHECKKLKNKHQK